jgi:hypothetical protein
VGTLIWLILNKGLPVGTWLQTMGLPSLCKVCDDNKEESPQHCFLECPMAQRAWEVYKCIWTEWQAPHNLVITWPFALLGEATIEQEDDPPRLLAYHTDGFTYPRQPLDILRSFIVYCLWTERCRKHFDDKYSLKAILTQAWVATVEVAWLLGRPLDPNGPPRTRTLLLASNLTLEKNGSTGASWGRITPPSGGTSSPPCIFFL